MADLPLLRVKDLTVRYDTRWAVALRDISFTVAPGERVLVAGASGSGKSTLGLCLSGLIPRAVDADLEGKVEVAGTPTVSSAPAALATRVGIVFQDPASQFTMLTVEDEVAFGLENHGIDRIVMRARVAEALAAVGLADRARWRIDRLSGGQQQRLALASALAMRPGVLVLDEPTSHLDPQAATRFYEHVRAVADKRGTTLVIIEHDTGRVVPHLARRCLQLTPDGRLAMQGDVHDVFGNPDRARQWVDAGGRLPGSVALARALGEGCGRLPVSEDAAAHGLTGAPDAQRRLRTVARSSRETATGDVVIEACNLWHRYRTPAGAHTALKGVSLTAREGELVAVVGTNGSGKTTLLRALGALIQPEHGTVRVDGQRIDERGARRVAQLVGYVFQNPESGFVADMVAEELAYAPRALGWRRPEVDRYVDASLKRFGLTALAAASPYTLSGGQKRRLSIAAALVAGPRVLLLDEPTYGQDETSARTLLQELSRLRERGVAVVVATHDAGLVAEVADRVVALAGGEAVFDGSPRDLFADEQLLALTGQERPELSRILVSARALGADVPPELYWGELRAIASDPATTPGEPG